MNKNSKRIKIRLKESAKKRYAMLILAMMFLFSVYLFIGPLTHVESAEILNTREYTVQTGDTLWEIAGNIAPKMDPREVIYDIRTLNGGESDIMYTGNTIVLPVY